MTGYNYQIIETYKTRGGSNSYHTKMLITFKTYKTTHVIIEFDS